MELNSKKGALRKTPLMKLVTHGITVSRKSWFSATGSFLRSLDRNLLEWDELIQPWVTDACLLRGVPSGWGCHVSDLLLRGCFSHMELLAGGAMPSGAPHYSIWSVRWLIKGIALSGCFLKVSSHLSWMLSYMNIYSCAVIYSHNVCPTVKFWQ